MNTYNNDVNSNKDYKKNNDQPAIDFGFHIVIPRVVRTGYKEVSLIQKWLYACLKDLCGDRGTCYRALRTLSAETGFSTGMLSESIQVLHKHKLIHAEKKKRSSGGKEVWHITITDIWQENAKIHPTKRSQREQTGDTTPVNENVHDTNVHTVNKTTSECSQYEQECSHCETEVITLSNNNSEVITESTYSADLLSQDQHASPSPSKLIIHPLYNFIALDDPIFPKQLIVYLTSVGQFSSEYEDKQRAFKAEEVKAELERRGHTVSYCWMHEAEPTIAPAIVESSADDNDSQSQELTPTSVANVNDTPPFVTTPLQSGELSPGQRGDVSPDEDRVATLEYLYEKFDNVAPVDSAFLPSPSDENGPVTSQSHNSPSPQPQGVSHASQSEIELLSTNEQASGVSYSPGIHPTTQPTSEQPPLAAETPVVAEKPKRSRKPAAPPPAKPVITLTDGAQFVYDEWCKLPWFKAKPDLTATLAGHCETAKAYEAKDVCVETMLLVRNWATSKAVDRSGFYANKGWNMKFFLNELPKWKSRPGQPQEAQNGTPDTSASSDMSDIERRQTINYLIDHPEQMEMAEQAYPDLAKIAKTEIEKLVARGA